MKDVITKEVVKYMIYEFRGKQVMLASDIAKLYQVETKRINEVVKRNIERFPDNFCFQLTYQEVNSLRSQNATSNKVSRGGVRYLPYVFTEHGIMMLSGLLKSDIAVKINVLIINAFVEMKNYISYDLMEQQYYKKLILIMQVKSFFV
ncbi:MAG: ORF6N domain-containing protein [Firmicutes bacterium]|nr:ORF6N domain-containing protein [Bacillota bacterium]